MMRFPLFCVAALLGAAVSAPAQVSIAGSIGRQIAGSVVVSHRAHDDHRANDRHGNDRHVHGRYTPVRARGHWQIVHEQVLVAPGYWSEEHVPPTYGWVTDWCGHRHWGVVDAGGCRRVWVPARYETRARRVWSPC